MYGYMGMERTGTSYRHSSSSAVWSLSHVNVVIFVVVVTTTVVIYIHIIHYIFLEQRRETLSYIQYYLIIHMVGATIVFQWRQRDDHIDTCCNVNYKQISYERYSHNSIVNFTML